MYRAPSVSRTRNTLDPSAERVGSTRSWEQALPGGCALEGAPWPATTALVTDFDQVSSWDLVLAVQGGDFTAFGEIYQRHYSAVFAFVLGMVSGHAQAEDITSETFLRAFRRVGSVRDQGKDLRVWLVAIARNIVIDTVRSAPYRRELGVASAIELIEDAAEPDQQIILNLTRQELVRCVQQLGDDQRECVILRFYKCLSVSATAEVMGRNQGAIRALQYRATQKLSKLVPGWVHTMV